MAANNCHNWERCLWTTKLYIMTTISITVAVYNEWWAQMVGLRHCISQGEFFFFFCFSCFILAKMIFTVRATTIMTNAQLSHPDQDEWCLRCNMSQAQRYVFFHLFLFFGLFFFLILLTFFTDHLNQLNKRHIDHHFCHLNISNKHQSGHHHLDSPWKWQCSNNPVLAPNHSNGRVREHIFKSLVSFTKAKTTLPLPLCKR